MKYRRQIHALVLASLRQTPVDREIPCQVAIREVGAAFRAARRAQQIRDSHILAERIAARIGHFAPDVHARRVHAILAAVHDDAVARLHQDILQRVGIEGGGKIHIQDFERAVRLSAEQLRGIKRRIRQ